MSASIRRFISVVPFIFLSILFSNKALAEDTIYAIIGGFGYTEFDISINQFGSKGDKTSLLMYKIGAAAQHENWTIKWTVENPLDEGELSFSDILKDIDFKYFSSDVSVSYKFSDNISVFAGYLNNSFTLSNDTTLPAFKSTGRYQQTYDELGFYLGMSYRFLFEIGTLNFSLAYANLDSEMKDNLYKANLTALILDGETTGFSYGVSWQGKITSNIAYTLNGNIRRYEFDSNFINGLKDFPGLDNIDNNTFDSDWNLNSISANIIYIF